MAVEEWPGVDDQILACEAEKARRLIRELRGGSPEEAESIRRERFRQLRTERPEEFLFAEYACEDYLISEWADQGCWDEPSQTMLIFPASKARGYPDAPNFLVVGSAGFDGIAYGYRKGRPGLWCYDPIGREFTFMAPTVASLVEAWLSGSIVH